MTWISGLKTATPPNLRGIVAHAHADTPHFPSNQRSLLAKLLYWYRNSLLRLFLSEGHNLFHRIGWIRQIRAVERGDGRGSIRQWMDEALIPSVCTTTYISHMQQTENHHPFLSIFDLLLLTRTWKAGWEYGTHIGRSQSQDISHSSGNSDGRNSMPLQGHTAPALNMAFTVGSKPPGIAVVTSDTVILLSETLCVL